MKTLRSQTVFIGLLALCFMQASYAEGKKPLVTDETLSLKLGTFITTFTSQLRMDSDQGNRGSPIDLEDELDLDSPVTSLRADLTWRFADRHIINGTYYKLNRDGDTDLARSLTIGNNTFTRNTIVESTLDISNFKLAYQYSFYQDTDLEFGASIGTHIMDIDATVRSTNINEEESGDGILPLPMFGVGTKWVVSEDVIVLGSAELFALDYGDWSGHAFDIEGDIEWNAFENVGFGLGLNYVDMGIEGKDNWLSGRLDYEYFGALIYTKFYF